MRRSTLPVDALLPRGWPRRVRSAVLHTIALARASLCVARGQAATRGKAGRRFQTENGRLRQEIALLTEEIRLKDARMWRVEGHHRPHFQPVERLAILELRAARGWSLIQVAERLQLTTATVSSWMRRLDEAGPSALVQVREPVNKFPAFVTYLVQRLKVLLPAAGYLRMAQTLGRAGLHLSATTIRRMLHRPAPPRKASKTTTPKVRSRRVIGRYAHEVWHCDLTIVPTSRGLWTPWRPFALTQRWPFCWWVALLADHYTRCILGFAVFEQQPTAAEMKRFLARATRRHRTRPKHLLTDHGAQFTDESFRKWSRLRGIHQCFGAIGQYGSIAVIERLIRTVKDECTRRLIVPLTMSEMRRELALFCAWYNHERPHGRLGGATPAEAYSGAVPASTAPRYEPRPKWPSSSPSAGATTKVRGRCGDRLDLYVDYVGNRKHLPIVTLERAA